MFKDGVVSYEGEFVRDQFHGQGTFTFGSGSTYTVRCTLSLSTHKLCLSLDEEDQKLPQLPPPARSIRPWRVHHQRTLSPPCAGGRCFAEKEEPLARETALFQN